MTASGAGVSQLKEVAKHMIDCTKTANYFAEKQRMIKKHKYVCELKILNCNDCPLNWSKNGMDIECSKLETNFPEKAIELIQQWSDENPERTFLTEFLKHYPKAQLSDKGLPMICPHLLGLMRRDDCKANCIECWNQSYTSEDGG